MKKNTQKTGVHKENDCYIAKLGFEKVYIYMHTEANSVMLLSKDLKINMHTESESAILLNGVLIKPILLQTVSGRAHV